MATTLACATLRVSQLQRSVRFYTEALSMVLVHSSDHCALVGWPERGALVELLVVPAAATEAAAEKGWCSPDTKRDAWVWLGLANITDVEASVASLAEYKEVETSARLQGELPGDTGEVGFVGHFRDPDGYALEVLQGTLKCNFVKPTVLPANVLQTELPVLGQLKVNTKDPERLLRFYCKGLGMKVVTEIAMSRFGLQLWFLAFTDEDPPDALDSPASRTWLWQAQFSQLEIQYWKDFESDQPLRSVPSTASLGFSGLTFACEDPKAVASHLQGFGAEEAPVGAAFQASVFEDQPALSEGSSVASSSQLLLDPDGRSLRLVSSKLLGSLTATKK